MTPRQAADASGARWFQTTRTREVYRGRVRVRVDDVTGPDGHVLEREIVEATDSVVVVALYDQDVVLVRQHRQAAGRALLELPAGVRDVDGEDAEQVAARELAEETGLGGGELSTLGTFWSSPGWTTERVTVVLARGVRPVGTPPGFEAAGEERHLEVVRLPFDVAVEAVRDSVITDGASAIGLLLAEGVVSGARRAQPGGRA